MKIDDDHLYHGAALIQIAEDPRFTAINSLKVGGKVSNSAFKINDHIAVYFKYAVKPQGKYKEFPFTFSSEQLGFLRKMAAASERSFVALVCVAAREVCVISMRQLEDLIDARQRENGGAEDQYIVLVTAPQRKSLRVYVNQPHVKGAFVGDPMIVSRSSFPKVIFEDD